MGMVELQKRLSALIAERTDVEAKYKADVSRLVAATDAAKKDIAAAGAGFDMEKIAAGRTVLYVHGQYAKAGDERAAALRGALSDLVSDGGKKLSREYFATKSYDRWHGQFLTCEYGMCPRHGGVIFEIGLTRDHAKRLREGGVLTEAEIEGAVYLLTILPQLQEAEAAAVAKVA